MTGIYVGNVSDIAATGAASEALISAVTNAKDSQAMCHQLMSAFALCTVHCATLIPFGLSVRFIAVTPD